MAGPVGPVADFPRLRVNLHRNWGRDGWPRQWEVELHFRGGPIECTESFHPGPLGEERPLQDRTDSFPPRFVLNRCLTPELLDSLSPECAEAAHSRRDLKLFNRVMGNPAWLRRTLPRVVRQRERVLEVGAGTGEVGLALSGLGLDWSGLDLVARPALWPASWGWHQSDIRTFSGWERYPVVVANLMLHHLENADLVAVGRQIDRHARAVVACEPARQRRWQWVFRGVCSLIRANHISRHDGHVSIAAGFRGAELPELLGLSPRRWRWTTTISARGVYRLVAQRIEP